MSSVTCDRHVQAKKCGHLVPRSQGQHAVNIRFSVSNLSSTLERLGSDD